MMTLRELLALFSEQQANLLRQRRMQQHFQHSAPQPTTLRDTLQQRQEMINTSPALNQNAFKPMGLEDYYKASEESYNRWKNPQYNINLL